MDMVVFCIDGKEIVFLLIINIEAVIIKELREVTIFRNNLSEKRMFLN